MTTLTTPGQEILSRTRDIDARTVELTRLLELLDAGQGSNPLGEIESLLTELLVSQREIRDRMTRIEAVLRARPVPTAPLPGATLPSSRPR